MTSKISNDVDYDLGPHAALIPINEFYSQNFDFSGFIPLVEEVYEHLCTFDVYRQKFPFSLFLHVMGNYLNLHILQVAIQNGQISDFDRTNFPTDYCIPKAIMDYFFHITDAISVWGTKIRLNLPNSVIPQGPIDGLEIPSGSFGIVNSSNHNSYEAYLCPLVTANRVIATQQKNADYQPLPSQAFPSELKPTKNLLGYGPIDRYYDEELLTGIDFPNDNSFDGRYKISRSTWAKVHQFLNRIKTIKMACIPHHLELKTVASNLTFVESEASGTKPLYDLNVNVYSNERFSSSTANQSNIETMHRRRIATGPNAAVGCCYVTSEGTTPEGWESTCNDNFMMRGLYEPVLYPDYSLLRYDAWKSYGPKGIRRNYLKQFLVRNYET